MSTEGKILVILNRYQNNWAAGGVVVRKILLSYGLENFDLLIIGKQRQHDVLTLLHKKADFQYSVREPDNPVLGRLLRKCPLVELVYVYIRKWYFRKVLQVISRRKRYQSVFTFLRMDVLLVLPDIIKILGVPLICLDTDSYWGTEERNKYLLRIKNRNFIWCLIRSSRLLTASETMQQYYRKEYNLESVILRLPFQRNGGFTQKVIKDELKILFIGNIYALESLLSFIFALEYISAKSKNLKITLITATHVWNKLPRGKTIEIVRLGWLEEEQLIPYLRACHIAYLPYPFHSQQRLQMTYAFPGKASPYITYQLPVFFHGPEYSSFFVFLQRYKVGVGCSSLNPVQIRDQLLAFIDNKEFYHACQQECEKAYQEELGQHIFDQRVKEAFGS